MLVKITLFKKANPSIDYTFLLNADNVLYFSVIGVFSTAVVFSVYGFLISIWHFSSHFEPWIKIFCVLVSTLLAIKLSLYLSYTLGSV